MLDKVKNTNRKIVLAQSNGKTHPIIGIWHLNLFESLKNTLNSGNRKIMNWASQHSLGYAEFTNSKYDPFFNINCKEDLIEAKEIENNNQIALYYCDENGEIDEKYNPNGSSKNIAGIFNKEKNILGMMPHPERMIDKYLSGDDGMIFFKNLLNNLK